MLDKLSLTLGDSDLTGNIHFRREGPRPHLKSKLAISGIPPALIKGFEGGTGGETKPRSTGTDIDWQALNRLDVDLELEVDRLDYRGETFRGLHLNTRLEAGKLETQLEPVAAFSKQLQGRLSIDASTEKAGYHLQAESTGLRFKDLIEFSTDSTPVDGRAGQVSLDVSGALGTGTLLETIDTLELKASELELERKIAGGKTIRMSFEQAHLARDPETGKLSLDGRGRLDGRPLDIRLRAGTLSQQLSATRRPLNLVLTSGKTRLSLDGHLSGKGEKLAYQVRLDVSTDNLAELGHLALVELPAIGPASIKGQFSGNNGELNWKDSRLTIGNSKLDSDGRLRFAGGKLDYSAKASFHAEEYELLIGELFPDFPPIGNLEALKEVQGDNRPLEIHFRKISVADSRITGHIQAEFDRDKPKLTIKGDADPLQLATFFKKTETGKAAGAAANDKERVIPDLVINTDVLEWVDMEGELLVKNLLYEENNLGSYTLSTDIRDRVMKVDAKIRSTYIADAKVHAEMSAREEVPEIRLQVENRDLDYGGLLKALDIADKVTGKLDFRLDARGRGQRLPELLAKADGVLKITGVEGKIDYAQLRLWGGGLVELLIPSAIKDDEKSQINCLAAHFTLEPGMFSSKGIVLDTDAATIGGTLEVALPSETLQGAFQPDPKNPRIFNVDTPIILGGTLAHPTAEVAGAGTTLLTVGKLATGLYNPVLLIAMFGSLGSHVENPCEAVLSGTTQTTRASTRVKVLDDAGKGIGKVGKGITDAVSKPFRSLFEKGGKEGGPSDQENPDAPSPPSGQSPSGNR
jgi:hypothetical protein